MRDSEDLKKKTLAGDSQLSTSLELRMRALEQVSMMWQGQQGEPHTIYGNAQHDNNQLLTTLPMINVKEIFTGSYDWLIFGGLDQGGSDFQKVIFSIQQTGFPITIYEIRYHKKFQLDI